MIVLRDPPIIFQSFEAIRLWRRRGERNIANLEQFGRGEKNHVLRIVIDGINQASLVDEESLEACFLGLDGAGHAGRTSAHDQHIGR